MIDAALAYIRSWFPGSNSYENSRKRRATTNISPVGCSKYRRILATMSNNTDGDIGRKRAGNPGKSSVLDEYFTLPIQSSTIRKPVDYIVIDDDIPKSSRLSELRRSRSFTRSNYITPVANKVSPQQNGSNDDVIFVKKIKSTERPERVNNVTYITKFNSNLQPNTTKIEMFQNGAKSKIKSTPVQKSTNRQQGGATYKSEFLFPNLRSPSLDYSIRLDDKKKYEEMLEQITPYNNSSSIYSTPIGQFYGVGNVSDRTRKMVAKALSPKDKAIEIIDLVHENNAKPRLSTKDTVIKVLDDFESEVNVIDDSDSDVEILPTPPSPKPEIKVDPVNSLKTIIDSSKTTQRKWLDNYSKEHAHFLKDKCDEIKTYTENSATLNVINRDLLIQTLSNRVKSCLSIKDLVLAVKDAEPEWPPDLTLEHLELLDRAWNGNPNEVLTKKFNLNLIRKDLLTLTKLNWLNDNVINFYMNLITERSNTNENWPKTYCTSTFFYPKLMSQGPESLRRWTKKVDIFAHEFICVPVHLGIHWCMSIIDLKEKTIKYYDSMGGKDGDCLRALRNYLEYEHMDKKGKPFSTADFILERVQDIPHQMNGSDCGMFSCTFAEFATRRAEFIFSQSDMPYLRKKMAVEIMLGQLLIQ